jgi:5'-nucleotidase
VNVALGNLVKGRVDMVVSGINMGSNVSIPLIMASGTVGAALEAACHGVHAMATSIRISRLDFEQRFQVSDDVIRAIAGSVEVAAKRTAELCAKIAAKRTPKRFLVHNLNFPPEVSDKTELVRTVPALLHTGTLFHPKPGTDQHEFKFSMGGETPSKLVSDRTVLEANKNTYSVLDFGRIGTSDAAHGRVPTTQSFDRENP